MLHLDYYSTTVKVTDTQSSDIPRLHHIFEYINCSTSCIFTSSNTNLDSLLAKPLSAALILYYMTPHKLRRRKFREGAAHELKPHCLLQPFYT